MTQARRVALCALLLAASVAAQDVLSVNRGTARRSGAPTDDRIGALHALTIAGALDPETACAAIAAEDEAVAAAAAALVRHRVALDDAWFEALDAAPRAARRLLDELAIAPRPSADAWLLRWAARPERTPDERCLALAARSGAWSADDRAVFLAGLLTGPTGDGVAAARRVLPGPVADAMVGRLHQEVAAGRLPFDEALRVFDRATPLGVRQLLGLALQLTGDQGASLLRHVHDQRPELVLERAQAELDDAARAVDPRWLPFVAPLLAAPQRAVRVEGLLAADDAATRYAAFDALLTARIASPAVLAFAAPEADADAARARLPRLLDRTIDALPEPVLRGWLARGDGIGEVVARFLPRRRELAAAFADELAAAALAAGTVDGRYFRPVALAVVGAGDEAAVRRLWPLVRGSADLTPFAEALVRRRAAWGVELLAGEAVAAAVVDDDAALARRRREALVARAELGDATAIPALVGMARSLSAEAARRCAQSPASPSLADAHALLDAVGVPRYGVEVAAAHASSAVDPAAPSIAAAIELLAWAARAAEHATIAARLQAFWRDGAPPALVADLQSEALPALARGPLAAALRSELRQALVAGPLDDRGEALAFAVVESLADPLDAEGLALCADLVLEPARRDRAGEGARAARWPDGRGGFALVGAVALRLRTAAPADAAAAFARAAADACADPVGPGATAARARAVLTALARAPEVRDAVGRALAPWLAAVPVAQGVWPAIVAAWWATSDAAMRGDVVGAQQSIGLALRLLHEPIGQPDLRRDLLGERDPGAGADPHAALACLPHRIAYLDAMQRGDARAAASAAAAWREFAGRDAATIADLPAASNTSPR